MRQKRTGFTVFKICRASFGLILAFAALIALGMVAGARPALADSDSSITSCTDHDGDGYGNPGDASCPNGASTDCDEKDNNCDGLVDHLQPACQTAEICDRFDNDGNGLIDDGLQFNGTPLGGACSVGTGICAKTGTVVCKLDKTIGCSLAPGSPGT